LAQISESKKQIEDHPDHTLESKENTKQSNRRIGSFSEDVAVKYLIESEYEILERNYRFSRLGEVDIIAKKGEYYCFVEVKSRRDDAFGTPAEAVTKQKKRKITLIAGHYYTTHKYSKMNIRFDVIEIYFSGGDATGQYSVKSINHIENAF
jgi:putative endonuclease